MGVISSRSGVSGNELSLVCARLDWSTVKGVSSVRCDPLVKPLRFESFGQSRGQDRNVAMTRKQVGNSSKRDGAWSVHPLRSRAKLKAECGRYLSSTWEPRSGERTEEPSTGDIICASFRVLMKWRLAPLFAHVG
jgi:hypothetical protein